MDLVLVVTLLVAATLALVAIVLVTGLVTTITELRKITTGLHVLRGALTHAALADPLPPSHDGVVDGTVTNCHRSGPA
jgi:hypothetical protein